MSRIGRLPVAIPAGVDVKIAAGNEVTVKGPKGELTEKYAEQLTIEQKDDTIIVSRPNDSKENRSLHGLTRTLINNMVVGVSAGYEKKLIMTGVGYKADKKGKTLTLSLGYSHPVVMEDPDGITTEVPAATEVIVRGIDKSLVGNYAAVIRAWRAPEPYKGKGIRYDGEKIRRKEGKAGVKG
ncbi:MAG: 50S ribosomal protein L6 [Clostridiales Family XIII bacterium]|jgi:large subunit ribosomal protein L6|nr:50S ribosomal protein L6 [Clostridiales Family XIII bacterium]